MPLDRKTPATISSCTNSTPNRLRFRSPHRCSAIPWRTRLNSSSPTSSSAAHWATTTHPIPAMRRYKTAASWWLRKCRRPTFYSRFESRNKHFGASTLYRHQVVSGQWCEWKGDFVCDEALESSRTRLQLTWTKWFLLLQKRKFHTKHKFNAGPSILRMLKWITTSMSNCQESHRYRNEPTFFPYLRWKMLKIITKRKQN